MIRPIIVRGGGDLASGVALRLRRAGLHPLVTELPSPLVVRRKVAFAEAHERAYGHTMPDPVEVVAVRLSAIGHQARPHVPAQERREGFTVVHRTTRPVIGVDGSVTDYAIHHRDDFRHGDSIAGPAVIGEHTGTTVLHAGDTASIGAYGEIVITVAGS